MFSPIAFFSGVEEGPVPSGFPAWDSTTNDIQQYLDAFDQISSTVTSPSLTASVGTTITLSSVYTTTNYVNFGVFFNPHNTDVLHVLPFASNQPQVSFKTYPGTFSSATFSYISKTSFTTNDIYHGGILSNNKNAYAFARDSNNIVKIVFPTNDTGTATASNIAISSAIRTACRMFDGKMIGCNDTQIVIFDPSTETTTTLNHGRGSGNGRWSDAVQAPNGKVYFIPHNSPNVLVYDPIGQTTSTISVTNYFNGYGGALLDKDGNVWGVRRFWTPDVNANMLLKINTSNDTVTQSGSYTSPILLNTGGIFMGIDSKIYAFARNGTTTNSSLIRINLSDSSIESVNIGNLIYLNNDTNWWGGKLHKDGNIWIPMSRATGGTTTGRFLKIPTTDTPLNLSDDCILGHPLNKLISWS